MIFFPQGFREEEKIMARPKEVIDPELARKAKEEIKSSSGYIIGLRLQAIISSTDHPINLVGAILGVSRQTVWRWIKRFKEYGVKGLHDQPRGHNPAKLREKQLIWIKHWLEEGLDKRGEKVHWTLARLASEIKGEWGIEISQTSLWRVIIGMGFRQKVPRPLHAKADKEAQEAFKKKPRRK